MFRRFSASSVVFFISLLGVLLPALASAAESRIPRNAFDKQGREDLAAPLREKGEIRVIVGLKAAALPRGRDNDAADRAFRSDVDARQTRLLQRLQRHDLRQVKRFRAHHFVAMTVDAAALDDLLADPDVASISEDRPLYPVLYDTPGITRADDTWVAGYRGAGQVVAIIDTGVDKSHPFFADNKVVAEACFSEPVDANTSYCPGGASQSIGPGSGVNCPDYNLSCWHGTHVAGIAAGKYGVLSSTTGGIAPDAGIIAIQVFQHGCIPSGCFIEAYNSDIALALEHVYSLRNTYSIAAVNMSLGADAYTATCDTVSPAITTIIENLRAANIATVVASGNSSRSNAISFPACISSAVSVGWTSKQNVVSSFSNSASFLSLLAPGGAVVSAVPGATYFAANGTSMAAPHVAGAWALLRSAKPTATVQEVLTALQSTGLPITDARNGIVKPLIQIGTDAAQPGALGVVIGQSNVAPSVALTAPANNAAFTAPATVALSATASDSDGTVTKVEFYNGAALLNTATTAPYTFNWTNVPAGSYSLTAKATDNNGITATSAAVTIGVTTPVTVAAATPIAAYRFNDAWGSTGVVADTVGARNGVRTGTVNPVAAPAAAPKPDTCQSASFSGGAIDVSGLPVVTAAGAKTTVAFWMFWNGTTTVMPLSWQTQDLYLQAGFFGFNSLNTDLYGMSSAGLANSWHHVVAEFTNGSIAANKIYIDGVQQTLAQRFGAPINSRAVVSSNLRIGGLSGYATYRFAGQIDEVKIFNGALTPAEVSAEYAATSPCASVPSAPNGLGAAAASSSQINLSWTDASSNENGFKLERKTGAGGTFGQIAAPTANATSYADMTVTPGNTYFYRIRAGNDAGDSVYSNETSVNFTVPAAPSGLGAVAASATQINLNWTDASSNETGFKLERKTGAGGTYAQIAAPLANATSYSDTTVSPGNSYFYRIRSNNIVGDSSYSNEASVNLAIPTAPSGLGATAGSGAQISLTWTDASTNETGFKLERKTGAGGTYAQIAAPLANATSYSDTTVSAGNTYVYRIRAANGIGDSAYSNEATASVAGGGGTAAIAAYPFNDTWGSTGVVADTVGGRNGARTGTVNPVAAPAAAPKPDTCQSASFSGGAIDVSALPVVTAAGAKTTVAFWMFWNGTNTVMPLSWQTQDLYLQAGFFGFNSLNTDLYGMSSAGLANSWHHVVAEFTNGNIAANKLYIDGVQQTLAQRFGGPINSRAVVSPNLRIGGLFGYATYRFAGQIDQVKIFNGTLSAAEVSAEFAAASPCDGGPPPPPPPPTIALQSVATGLVSPVDITNARDGSGRLFVVQQTGQIKILSGGQVLPTAFLDIQSLVLSGGERGLLGLAFHPNYASNGYFYVNYTRQGDGATVIARYQRSTGDPNVADFNSGSILLTVAQPFNNHNGGQLRFGPDGFLYIGLGDGGSGNDPGNRAQNLNTLLGKMLRIDVNSTTAPYDIPSGNPFQSDGNPNTLPEIWAYGLRNPWRFSFDRLTGDLFIADVGQSAWEEINFQAAGTGAGANYGWRVMEGAHCTNLGGGAPCFDPSFVPPILEYGHDLGCSVTGGHRYRGTAYPALAGYFVFGDYCSGRIWGATPTAGVWTSTELLDTSFNISTFGEDEAGELYVASLGTGVIYRIIQSSGPPQTLGADWATRSAGRKLALPLTSPAAGDANLTGRHPRDARGVWDDGNPRTLPVIDAKGLRYDVEPGKGTTDWYTDLGARYGANSVMYAQWQMMFSREFVETVFESAGGYPGEKLAVFSAISNTSSYGKLVVSTLNQWKFPFFYQYDQNGNTFNLFSPLARATDFDVQPKAGLPATCRYNVYKVTPPGHIPAGCAGLVADKWITFDLVVTTGDVIAGTNTWDADRKLYMTIDGKRELVIQYDKTMPEYRGRNMRDFEAIWLAPYMTGKSMTQQHPVASVWFRELIVDDKPIPQAK